MDLVKLINSINVNVEGVAVDFKPVDSQGSWIGAAEGKLYMMPMQINGMPSLEGIHLPSKMSFRYEIEMLRWLETVNEALGTNLDRNAIED
jgi:hypothetical protein